MGKKILLQHIDVPGIETYSVYREKGGYASVEKALKMKPDDVVEEVKKSGLRGDCGRPSGPTFCADQVTTTKAEITPQNNRWPDLKGRGFQPRHHRLANDLRQGWKPSSFSNLLRLMVCRANLEFSDSAPHASQGYAYTTSSALWCD